MRHLIIPACLTLFVSPLSAQGNSAGTGASQGHAAPAAVTTGYGAWFGSIPNMDGGSGGVLIDGTTVGSPAEKAGLKAGDRILSIGGNRMEDLRSMVEVLRVRQPGDTVEVIYQRRGTLEKTKVILGVRPGN